MLHPIRVPPCARVVLTWPVLSASKSIYIFIRAGPDQDQDSSEML